MTNPENEYQPMHFWKRAACALGFFAGATVLVASSAAVFLDDETLPDHQNLESQPTEPIDPHLDMNEMAGGLLLWGGSVATLAGMATIFPGLRPRGQYGQNTAIRTPAVGPTPQI